MKLITWLGIVLALSSALTSSRAVAAGRADPETAFDADQLSHQLIVFYPDRSLVRRGFASANLDYGRDSDYRGSSWSIRRSTDLARDYHLHKLTEWPMERLGMHCVVYQIAPGMDLEEVLRRLAADQRVATAQRMHRYHVLAGDPYSGVQRALKSLAIAPAHRYATGRHVTVGVVDTGVDLEHPDLRGQIARHVDLVGNTPSPFNEEIHGTAVAGIIAAAADNEQGIVGVAPDAKLVILRACWAEKRGQLAAVCSSLTLARAFEAALDDGINVLNLSLAGPPDPLLTLALRSVLDAHVIVIAAEPDRATASDLFPSAIAGVIRARAMTNTADDGIPVTTVIAPGTDILTTFPGAAYDFISGNSFAAAHVSGITALLLQLQPDLSGAAVQQVLLASQHRPVPAAARELVMVNACEAVRTLNPHAVCAADEADGDDHRPARVVSSPTPAFNFTPLAPVAPLKILGSHPS